MTADSPLIFLSYASQDKARVKPYFDRIEAGGGNAWIDYKRIKAGQDWDFEIKRALDKASVVIIFLSETSVDKRGYVQRELRAALDKAKEKLATDIYIIPVLLDDLERFPDEIKHIHCVKAWESDSFFAIETALNYQLQTLGAELRATKERSNINWIYKKYNEAWDGVPGYEIEYLIPEFSSAVYRNIGDVTKFLHGKIVDYVMDQRSTKFWQIPDIFNFADVKFSRTNTLDMHCGDPVVSHNVLSIIYSIHTYGAGAAHPNMNFLTYSFFLDPLVRIVSLEILFIDKDASFNVIQNMVRRELRRQRAGDEYSDPDWIDRGTSSWADFQNFIFDDDHITFLFAPYAVDCFAAGPQYVNVNYDVVAGFMTREAVAGLSLQRYLRQKL